MILKQKKLLLSILELGKKSPIQKMKKHFPSPERLATGHLKWTGLRDMEKKLTYGHLELAFMN